MNRIRHRLGLLGRGMWLFSRTRDSLFARIEQRLGQLEQRLSKLFGSHSEALEQLAEKLGRLEETQRCVEPLVRSVADELSRDLAAKLEAADREMREVLAALIQSAAGDALQQVVTKIDARAIPAELIYDLGGKVENTAALTSSLRESVEQGFGQIVQRLEKDLVTLAQITHRLDATVAQEVGGLTPRLSEALRAENAGLVEGLGQRIDQVTQLSQRLDRDVVQGFGAIAQRLESDLVALAERTHTLIGTVSQHSGMLAKMVLDQGELTESVRALHRLAPLAPAVTQLRERASGLAPASTWLLLAEAGLPVSLQRKLKSRGFDRRKLWTVGSNMLPSTPVELPRLIDIMRAGRPVIRPGESFVLALPFKDKPLLDTEEMRQVAGLLGPVSDIFDMKDGDNSWRIVHASARCEAMGVTLRWSLAALEELNLRLGPVIHEALKRFSLEDALHALDLPDTEADFDYWQRQVGAWANLMARCERAVPGIVLPLRFDAMPELMAKGIAHVRTELRLAGVRDDIAFQWVRGSVPLQLSDSILAFARTYGVRFDCTAVNRGSAESRLEAYDDLLPFRSLSFDLRLPSFGDGRHGPIEIARWSGRVAANGNRPYGSDIATLPQSFDRDFERICRRLAPVLDRGAQHQFELQVNLDATLFGYWASYFVYNWALPQPASFRLYEFDASDLTALDSPLARLQRENALGIDDRRRLSGAHFLTLAEKAADENYNLRVSARNLQVEEHSYQRERLDITADAERLIKWMPEKLGITLELGCGLGVMARRIGRRAELYTGLDLTVDQAISVRDAGAVGLVSDIHSLPFGTGSVDTIIADNVIEHAHVPILALRECHRILRPGGAAYLLIPYDFRGPEYRNAAHFWKADEASVRHAVESAGFLIARQETVRMQELGVRGAYPSCDGYTGLWEIQKPESSPSSKIGESDHGFDLETSRRYWRFAPSGAGKHDTAELIKLPDAELEAEWDQAFAARLGQYAEEEQFLQLMASEFSSKKVLSIGPGLGLHEIYYQLHGAEMTCCDVVSTNLAVIERVAKIKSAKPIETIVSRGATQPLGGAYDVVFIYGSLMTMPEAEQRELLVRATAALSDEGRIILMLYTWEFARATCGWTKPTEFDPSVFARASDPSVGDEHCPWSDWHDNQRVEALAGPDWAIARRQLWNQGWYVWYELTRSPPAGPMRPFFEFARADAIRPVYEFDLRELERAQASLQQYETGLEVTTDANNAGYALSTGTIARDNRTAKSNAILLDIDLQDGGCSVGVLDPKSDSFIASHAIWQLGRAQHVFAIPALPKHYRLILSNHHPGEPGPSKFTVHRLALLHRKGVDLAKL